MASSKRILFDLRLAEAHYREVEKQAREGVIVQLIRLCELFQLTEADLFDPVKAAIEGEAKLSRVRQQLEEAQASLTKLRTRELELLVETERLHDSQDEPPALSKRAARLEQDAREGAEALDERRQRTRELKALLRRQPSSWSSKATAVDTGRRIVSYWNFKPRTFFTPAPQLGYRSPMTGQTWDGVGEMPIWLADAFVAGVEKKFGADSELPLSVSDDLALQEAAKNRVRRESFLYVRRLIASFGLSVIDLWTPAAAGPNFGDPKVGGYAPPPLNYGGRINARLKRIPGRPILVPGAPRSK